jgi:hypothetical protein
MIVPGRYNGPPGSANGGYMCGLVAGVLGGVAEVTLRLPPPLDRELEVVREDGRVEIRDGEAVVAEAEGVALDVEVPPAVSVEEAAAASRRYAGFVHHAYNTCFVCGPGREDGLRVYAGPVEGRPGLVASPWTPGEEPRPELVWAALDCPSGWAVDDSSARASSSGAWPRGSTAFLPLESRTSSSAGGSARTGASGTRAPPSSPPTVSCWRRPAQPGSSRDDRRYRNRSRSGGMTSSRALPSPGGAE